MVIIRADGNSEIGFGHLMRMTALARELVKQGAEVIFLTRNPENIAGYEAIGIPGSFNGDEEDELLRRSVAENKANMLIIDSYAFNRERLDKTGQLNLVSVYIDDMNQVIFYVDLVVNGNLYAPRLDYQGEARFLLGSEYLLMREQFRGVSRRVVKPQVENILLTFGAADMGNMTVKVLGLLRNYQRFNDFTWHIVIGPAFTHRDEIERITQGFPNIYLHSNPAIKNLMDFADIAISAAGSTAYELAACGVPAVLVTAADNQVMLAEEAGRQGLAINLGWHHELSREGLLAALDTLINDYESRRQMAARGQALVDGRGAERVATILLGEMRRKNAINPG